MNLHNNHTGGLGIFGFTRDVNAGIKGDGQHEKNSILYAFVPHCDVMYVQQRFKCLERYS